MGVRPPSSDDSDDVGTVEFGIAAVDERLDRADVTFPASGAAVVDALDDPEVAYDPHGNTVPLSRMVDRCDAEQFERRNELLNALHPVFEDVRTSSGTGVLGWLRSVVPGR